MSTVPMGRAPARWPPHHWQNFQGAQPSATRVPLRSVGSSSVLWCSAEERAALPLLSNVPHAEYPPVGYDERVSEEERGRSPSRPMPPCMQCIDGIDDPRSPMCYCTACDVVFHGCGIAISCRTHDIGSADCLISFSASLASPVNGIRSVCVSCVP